MSSALTPDSSKAGMSGTYRLAAGGLIDRARTYSFRFDGVTMNGFAGDTLASALIANGVSLVGRSFKYHRPRGILTDGSEEPNALVELRDGSRREPNSKATTVELFEGLSASSQNRWPSLKYDLLAINSLFSPFIAAGFYYKTFMWPAGFWEKVYEPLIRRAAGLGRAAVAADPDHYEQAFEFCDVLIIGSGPSGISAALAAGRAGARVILCDQDFQLGGRLLSERYEINGMGAREWVAKALQELAALSNVRLMPRTVVFGSYDGGTFGAVERVNDHVAEPARHQPRQRLWRIVARRTILAAGATERGLAFGGNDRPGVMMASAMRTYVNRFAAVPSKRLAVFTNNNDGWRTATDLKMAGVNVVAIVDPRKDLPNHLLANAQGIRVIAGAEIMDCYGGQRVTDIDVRLAGGGESIHVDAVAMSGGWNPNLALATHRVGQPVWDEKLAAFVPGQLPKSMGVVGSAAGTMSLNSCLNDGLIAGNAMATELDFKPRTVERIKSDDEQYAIKPLWQVKGACGKVFVDYQNDVTVKDIALSVQEGFKSVEHLKRYTTLSMGTDQGKNAALNGVAIFSEMTKRTIPQTGTTTARPPYVPVAIGALAGTHQGKQFRPVRLTPSHKWATEQGAVFVETGPWLRAQYFPQHGEVDWLTTVNREVLAVRQAVGFCDVSTLGKIDVQGPDAGAFLDRLYANTFSTLPIGKARYGLMLREDGFVMDDGTTSRLASDRFFLTTTTTNAGRVFQHMKFCHQVHWPELDVQFVSVTDDWAQFSVAGPHARDTLAPLLDNHDISNDALPYMGVMELTICGGVPARLYRLSFSGELAYEIGVPTRYGDSLARKLMEVGAPFGITPYGTEALGVMRIEKGHIGGNEIDGRTTAADLGLGRMMSKKKDYIGRTLSQRSALLDPDRMALVGFKPADPNKRLRAGSHLIKPNTAESAINDIGVITSVAFSPSLNHWVGLGLVRGGSKHIGAHLRAVDPIRDDRADVEVVDPCFIDQEGVRLRA